MSDKYCACINNKPHSGSGTCSGNCGLFVQGQYRAYSWIPFYNTQCTAYGNDLKAAVDKIHANGCQTCGWIVTNQSGSRLSRDPDFQS